MKKSIKASLVSTTLAASLLLSSTGAFAFTDTAGHWAATDIETLGNQGYITGYTDGTFAPDNVITRAEFVTIINRVKGVTSTDGKTFPDVSTDAWYANEINKAYLAGFITGYEDGTIKPDAPITRAEAAVVCYKAWDLTPDGSLGFTDSDQIGSWAKTQIATLVSKNVLSGYPDGSFQPSGPITRAEVAKIVSRMIALSANSPSTSTSSDGNGSMPNGVAFAPTSGSTSSGTNNGGGGGSSSTTISTPTSTQKKALETVASGDADESDDGLLTTILKYVNKSSSIKVTKDLMPLYIDAIDGAVNAIDYDDYDLSKKNDAVKFADDVAAIVKSVNKAVDRVKSLAKKSTLTTSMIDSDYSTCIKDMESIVNKDATKANRDDINDALADVIETLYDNLADEIDNIKGKNLKDKDIADIYNGTYDPSTTTKPTTAPTTAPTDAPKPSPDASTKPHIEAVVNGTLPTVVPGDPESEKALTDALESITKYAATTLDDKGKPVTNEEDIVAVEQDLLAVYSDAIAKLRNEITYDNKDKNVSTKVSLDVSAAIEVTNQAVDKVVELASNGALNGSAISAFKADIYETIEKRSSKDNAGNIKDAMTLFAVDLYDKLSDSISDLNTSGKDLSEEELRAKVIAIYQNADKADSDNTETDGGNTDADKN